MDANKLIYTKNIGIYHTRIFMKSSLGRSSLDCGKKCPTLNLDPKHHPSGSKTPFLWDPKHCHPVRYEICLIAENGLGSI